MELKKTLKANLENKKGIFFQIGFIIVLAVVLITFEWTTSDKSTNNLGKLEAIDIEDEIIPITRQQEVKPPPPPPPPKVTEVLQIVEDDVEIEDEIEMEDTEADQETEIIEIIEEEEAAEDEVFIIVEEMPVFPGGQLALLKYINSNIKYPPNL